MLNIDAITKSLALKLDATPTTPLVYTVDWLDINGTVQTPGNAYGTLANTTLTTVAPAPGSGVQRVIASCRVYNADNVTQPVSFILVVSATNYPLKYVQVAPGSTANIDDPTPAMASPIGSAMTSGQFGVGNSSNILMPVAMSGDGTLSNTGALTVTGGTHLAGVTDGSAASAGMVGEIVSAGGDGTLYDFPTSAQWGNNLSMNLTPGDWDISALVDLSIASGFGFGLLGISTHNGNDSTGLTPGVNRAGIGQFGNYGSGVIPGLASSISVATTIYLKVLASYSGGTQQYAGRLSARRVR